MHGSTTSTTSTTLLALYRAAREHPTQSFQDHALRLIQPLLKFDTAIWGTGTTDGRRVAVATAHLHEVDPLAIAEWQRVNDKDKVTQLTVGSFGSTVHVHMPTVAAESEDAAYRAYVAKWRRRDTLVTSMPEDKAGALQWISLYRHTGALYSQEQRAACELVMPHFAEALKINRLLEHSRNTALMPAAQPLQPLLALALALADANGRLWFAQSGFLDLLHLEWAEIDDAVLPRPLIDAIAGRRSMLFVGRAIKVQARYGADLVLLEVQRKTLIDALPPQRARVAALYAAGHAYKEIARRLRIAPATVRNQIAAAYRDLGISNKAQLAALASQQANANADADAVAAMVQRALSTAPVP